MKRRDFIALTGAASAAAATSASAQGQRAAPPTVAENRPAPALASASDGRVGTGDRIAGSPFAMRSTVWGTQAAAATAHPLATLTAIDLLRAGGTAVDAAIAANAVLGLLEPTACGIGGDVFAMVWDPRERRVVGLNGSGRSPRALSLETVRSRAVDGGIPSVGALSVSTPGAVDGWWALHQRFGSMRWGSLFEPAIALAERGAPVPQTIAYYLERALTNFSRPGRGIEEVENAKRTYAPGGRTPREGEVFRNPDLARTYRMIADGGRDAFYNGPIAEVIDRYFRRIGGWLSREDLAAHRAEWTEPYRTAGWRSTASGPTARGCRRFRS